MRDILSNFPGFQDLNSSKFFTMNLSWCQKIDEADKNKISVRKNVKMLKRMFFTEYLSELVVIFIASQRRLFNLLQCQRCLFSWFLRSIINWSKNEAIWYSKEFEFRMNEILKWTSKESMSSRSETKEIYTKKILENENIENICSSCKFIYDYSQWIQSKIRTMLHNRHFIDNFSIDRL